MGERAMRAAQIPQLLLTGSRAGGGSLGTRQQQEQEEAGEVRSHANWTRGFPVICDGTGSPIIASSVGATSCSAP